MRFEEMTVEETVEVEGGKTTIVDVLKFLVETTIIVPSRIPTLYV